MKLEDITALKDEALAAAESAADADALEELEEEIAKGREELEGMLE